MSKMLRLTPIIVIITVAAGCVAPRAATPSDPRPSDEPTVVFASIDLSCKGGGKFSLSTGTNGGTCDVFFDPASGGNTAQKATCKDDKGNKAEALCNTNGGQGSCNSTSGSGSCSGK